ncbi:hypothetical protein B0H17DRAFT_1198151 [Mycena rosella]|uniref:Uncharacterized protein n=1 Tax=Mycena rosella TaxID=1033263 RepID=A0AAD7DPQ7_MYCRO|nr:hypothetical protein B0H17DRAFT_1198151 [Mycena rosella]
MHRLVEKLKSAPRAMELDLEALGRGIEERLAGEHHHHAHGHASAASTSAAADNDDEGWASDHSAGSSSKDAPALAARRTHSKSPKTGMGSKRRVSGSGAGERKGLIRYAQQFTCDHRPRRAVPPPAAAAAASSISGPPTPPEATDFAYARASGGRQGRHSQVDSLRTQHSVRGSREAPLAQSVFGEEARASLGPMGPGDGAEESPGAKVTFDLPDLPDDVDPSPSGRGSGAGSGSGSGCSLRTWSPIIEDSITAAFQDFCADLMDVLSTHAGSLKRLRISLPQSNLEEPFSGLSLHAPSFPTFPMLAILDLTHCSPTVADLKIPLVPRGPLPTLEHHILDQGTAITDTDIDDDDDEEVGPGYDFAEPEAETRSWPALGVFLAAHPTPPRSLSTALRDLCLPMAFPRRLDQAWLQKALCAGATEGMVVCTAWSLRYDPREGEEEKKWEADLYVHAPGCGHLAYPRDQRPTTGLWPAATDDGLAMEIMKGRPWY